MIVFKTTVNLLLGKFGFEIRKKEPLIQPIPQDMTVDQSGIINIVNPYTMTSNERIYALINAVDYVCENNIEGDYVECGVWRGGSTMAAALRLIEKKQSHRKLFLYDTYEGMPAPTEHDFSVRTGHAQEKFDEKKISEDSSDWCLADLNDVTNNISSTNYPSENINYVKGKVEDTIPSTIPDKIAILRLDTDWYASTKHEMEHLYPRLVKGGVLIIDDYGHWEGCRKAVDEYFAKKKISKPLLIRVDYTGRVGIKP